MRRKNKVKSGKSFCHVDKITHIGQVSPGSTFGNQKWAGAAPALVINPRKINHLGRRGDAAGARDHRPPRIRADAPRICARRYFVADSCSAEVLSWIMSGVKARRFNSIPANMVSQFGADKAMNEPVIIRAANKECGNFRRGIRWCEVRGESSPPRPRLEARPAATDDPGSRGKKSIFRS